MVWENESRLIQEDFNRRVTWLLFFIGCCFTVIFIYLFYLQVVRGGYYYRASVENSTQFYLDRAPRGFIYDRNNKVLCRTRPVPRVLFYPFVRSAKLSQGDIDKIESLLPGSSAKLISAHKSKNTICLAENISREAMFKLLEQKNNLPGISVVMESRRFYPHNELACHLLGYVGEIERGELTDFRDQGYKLGDIIGKLGIEKQYDAYLRGKDGGWLMESDADGKDLSIARKIEPVPGHDIYLTLDMDLQARAEQVLEGTGCNGAVVGLDPRSGAVRILASRPGFNPNIFVESCEDVKEERRFYLTDTAMPLYNRCIQGQYPPGSVFKIVTAVAALTEHTVDVEKEYKCTGSFRLGRRRFKCWKEEGHGRMSFVSAIENSCNVYFYNIGLQAGVDHILEYARKFHLGQKTGIDLPSEKSGYLPQDLPGKRSRKLYEGDLINMAIGQGYIDVTALQLAVAMSAVANRGSMYRPYILDKVVNVTDNTVMHETEPERVGNVELPDEVWDMLQQGLERVVSAGTGRASKVYGLVSAGKTGTAQNPHGDDHAWFAAYAPVEDPEFVLVVFVEHGGMGGSIAAPAARRILSSVFPRKNVKR